MSVIRNTIAAAAVLAAAAGLTACGGATTPAPVTVTATAPAPAPTYTAPPKDTATTVFLRLVHQNTTTLDGVTDARFLEVGHLTCDVLDDGYTVDDVLRTIQRSTPQSQWLDWSRVTGTAVGSFCPEHSK